MVPVEDRRPDSVVVNGSHLANPDNSSVDQTQSPEVQIKPYRRSAPEEASAPESGSVISDPEKVGAPASDNVTDQNASAVKSLLRIANNKIQLGQHHLATDALERALRYEPKNAKIWSKLAQVRLLQQDYSQAESSALKSNSLAMNNKSLMRDNWRLISQARRLRGDEAGADAAEATAYQLLKK